MEFQVKALLLTFALTVVMSFVMIPILRRLKVGQQERSDGPESHLKKQGTPTMGGFIFIIPCLILYLVFFITPFFRGIGISLTNWDGLTPKTPIILEKSEFESKILFSKKLNQKDRNYLQDI